MNFQADEEEEPMCRYCFENDEEEELISPCLCSGGQKFVHLNCLRRWQRMVLVSQPTHPAFYEDDVRHHKCNVCMSEYTCPPPTRGELMESFTGPEIAALLMTDRIICSRDIFSDALEQELEGMSPMMRAYSSYEHWVKGTYLIYSVEKDKPDITLPLTDQASIVGLRSKLNDKLEITLQGKTYRLVAEKSLARAMTETASGVDEVEAIRNALEMLRAPAEIVLASTTPITSADDNIAAVNLYRQVSSPRRRQYFENIVDKVALKYPRVRDVDVRHFIGGPVSEDEIGVCIVTGSSRGWTVVDTLERALLLSLSRRSNRRFGEAQGEFGGGQIVEIIGLKSRTDLNGQFGMTARFVPSKTVSENSQNDTTACAGRWEVLLCNGEGVRVKPFNLRVTAHAPATLTPPYFSDEGKQDSSDPGRVLVFWGVARWTRAQLLGEIARGHWGLCRASAQEFILRSSAVWKALVESNRLVYAPPSDMTDQLVSSGDAQREMEAVRRVAELSNETVEVEDEQGDEEIREMESAL